MTKEDITLITAIAGITFGFLGAVLGVVNTWRAIDRDRLRLRVRPVWLLHASGETHFGIEVTNLCAFPVTVTSVGFTLKGSKEVLTFAPGSVKNCHLPERMDPRTSFTAQLPFEPEEHPASTNIKKAYARTACGKTVLGTSPALKGLIEKAKHEHS